MTWYESRGDVLVELCFAEIDNQPFCDRIPLDVDAIASLDLSFRLVLRDILQIACGGFRIASVRQKEFSGFTALRIPAQ
jgi:hypothetical protein